MQICEYFFENACYSVTKYYLCKQNNKRSLLGRKQRHQVVRSFPNRYLFSYTDKVTSLFSISCILDIILQSNQALLGLQSGLTCSASATCCETGRYGKVKEQGKPIVRQPPLPDGIPIIRYFSCRGWLFCFFSLPLLVRRPDVRPLPAGAGAVGTPGRTLPHAAGTRERQRHHREW